MPHANREKGTFGAEVPYNPAQDKTSPNAVSELSGILERGFIEG
jgi:hypothetical protein